MKKRWFAVATPVLLVTLLFLPPSPGNADEYYPAFLILHYFAEGASTELARNRDQHRRYWIERGRTMARFRLLDDDGEQIGIGSWAAFDSEEDARRFVADDPYTNAGVYRSTTITRANVYLLDKWFSIAPGWLDEAALSAMHARYQGVVERRTR